MTFYKEGSTLKMGTGVLTSGVSKYDMTEGFQEGDTTG